MLPRKALLAACVSACLVSACNEDEGSESGANEAGAGPAETAMTGDETSPADDSRRAEPRSGARKDPADAGSKKLEVLERVRRVAGEPASGEVPDALLEKIIADLARKIDAEPAHIEVLHAESLTWNDGSLGCGVPGRVYTQALVPGYRVILGHEGQRFDYRAAERGFFMLCERPALTPPGAAGRPPVE